MNLLNRKRRPIGLAVVGCGKIGRIRASFARQSAAVEWIGLCDVDEKTGRKLAEDVEADFFTTDYRELLRRDEVNSAIFATYANERLEPVLESAERGHRMLIEKPLAVDASVSARLAKSFADAGADVVVGYTQRFRRRFLAAKEKIRSGALGEVSSLTARAFLNRMNPVANSTKTEFPTKFTPHGHIGHPQRGSVCLVPGGLAPGGGVCAFRGQGDGPVSHKGFHVRHPHV